MRRRDRWRGLAWLQWMDGDGPERTVAEPQAAPAPVAQSMETLILAYRRYLDFEQISSGYRIRVLPAYGTEETGMLNFGACYAGKSVSAILSAAVVDCDLVTGGFVAYRLGANEVWRWVP